MNTQPTHRLTATIMVVALLLSTGCTMPPWRGERTAKHDATHEYIDRTVADIQYDTNVATPANAPAYAEASPNDYETSSRTRSPRTDNSASGSSCCQ